MSRTLSFTREASRSLTDLESDKSQQKQLKAVRKTLALLEVNLRHPSLRTHKYASLSGPDGEEVFEAYAGNQTPGAFRIFWHYGPGQNRLTIVAITPHP